MHPLVFVKEIIFDKFFKETRGVGRDKLRKAFHTSIFLINFTNQSRDIFLRDSLLDVDQHVELNVNIEVSFSWID